MSSPGASPQGNPPKCPLNTLSSHLPASQPSKSRLPTASSHQLLLAMLVCRLLRTKPQGEGKGEAEVGFLPMTHPRLGCNPASSQGGESKRTGWAGWVSPQMRGCTHVGLQTVQRYLMPSSPTPKRTPEEAASSWCFAVCLWVPVLGGSGYVTAVPSGTHCLPAGFQHPWHETLPLRGFSLKSQS